MSDRRSILVYLAVFALIGALAGETYRLVDRGIGTMGCRRSPKPDSFLAYCDSTHFGNYEHGAYYFGTEPSAIEHLRRADVIFFGNSRAQFAFSTEAVKRYFRERSIRFYSLGFGYGEQDEFPLALIRKYALTPKVMVIDPSPFFTGGQSIPSYDITRRKHFWMPVRAWLDNATKKAISDAQLAICSVIASLCTLKDKAIHRSHEDGTWIWHEIFVPAEENAIAVDQEQGQFISPDRAREAQSRAETFFKAAGVSPTCVVLTEIPNSEIQANSFPMELAKLTGAHVALPQLKGLTTIDNVHLTASSAERWSSALLHQIDPIIRSCAGASTVNREEPQSNDPDSLPN
jgi:hypothetical protein